MNDRLVIRARRLACLVRSGLSPRETLRAATLRAAEPLGWEDGMGTLEPGRSGDRVAVPPIPSRTTPSSSPPPSSRAARRSGPMAGPSDPR